MNATSTAAIVIGGALIGVYVVFQYLDAKRVHALDIETAVATAQDVRCEIEWQSAETRGVGILHIGDRIARLDYVFTDRRGASSEFDALYDSKSGDAYVWSQGDRAVVHLKDAATRTDIQDAWWNIAQISSCSPLWIVRDEMFALPTGAQVTTR